MTNNEANRFSDIELQFPGIEFKEEMRNLPPCDSVWARRSVICSTYQDERQLLRCFKQVVADLRDWTCEKVIVKYSESWWDCSTYFNKDDAIGALFEDSLSRYITKFDVERIFWSGATLRNFASCCPNKFNLCIKLHELPPNLDTNIGPNLLERISAMFNYKVRGRHLLV